MGTKDDEARIRRQEKREDLFKDVIRTSRELADAARQLPQSNSPIHQEVARKVRAYDEALERATKGQEGG